MLVVLLFRLNILILSREGLEKKFLAGAGAPASLPLSPSLLPVILKLHFYIIFMYLKRIS
jgi:hypothetical protein